MSVSDHPSAAACPGCIALPDIARRVEKTRSEHAFDVQISLPSIHCASCISGVERGLMQLDSVEDVRVNLTRKRATVRVAPGTEPDTIVHHLERLGFEAQPLDNATLTAGESDKQARDLMMRFGVAGFSSMNVMLLSVAIWAGATDATRDMFHWLSAAIALPTIAFSAQPFFKSGFAALRAARLNMDVPISLAILLAAGMSLFETINSGEHAYFDAALSLTFFLLAGRFLDQKMRSTARSAAAELAALEAPTALRVVDGDTHTVKVTDVSVGDILLVRPGARIPVDGDVIQGASEMDRAFLTGETDPVAVAIGAQVRAGEVNLTGPLHIRTSAVGPDTLLHGLADLVSVAEEAKSRYNSLADRAAQIYAPAVHLLALIGFVVWMYLTAGDVRTSLNIAVALLIITCPCALGLAVPAVSTVASGGLFKRGLLVKHATALERLAEIDEVVFDKTGTLTRGTPTLTNPQDLPDHAFALAAALALGSNHPRSKAIAKAAEGFDLPDVQVTDIVEHPGLGVEAKFQGQTVRLGRAEWVTGQGDSSTCLGIDGQDTVQFTFEDTLRPGAAELLQHLRDRNIPVMLLSGDAENPVAQLAQDLNIPTWQSGVLPSEKAAVLEAKRAAGKRVLMVGDGLNDTAALAVAHVSIAPASALEATRVAADLVLVSPDLSRIQDSLRIAKSARKRILENFGVAAVYNSIAIPIAFVGLATPLTAAIAMSTSSILVSLNALRTR
ncbi:heavy metal translocating P-type ATPase [Aestuariibius sp. HNIBRBA575]|uniref:heavy metal translocating P-type ATPase n=1 Tax=Aestuariibius sp. HNIBRBA575 TaxID=3233343 RepID=UPI0034A3E07D